MGLTDVWYERRGLIAAAAAVVALGIGLYLLLSGGDDASSGAATAAATNTVDRSPDGGTSGADGDPDQTTASDPRCVAVEANEPGVDHKDLKACETEATTLPEREPQAPLGPQGDTPDAEHGTQSPIDGPVDSTPDQPRPPDDDPDTRGYPEPDLRFEDRPNPEETPADGRRRRR